MTDPASIAAPMPIRTPRLVIRPKQAGDGIVSARAVAETWNDLCLWMTWATDLGDFTPERQEIRSQSQYEEFVARSEFNLVGTQTATGEAVIWCSLYEIDWVARLCHTGCWVRSTAQGKGFATETINAMVRYAFGALGMKRVGFTYSRGNEASRRLAEKLSFSFERIERGATLLPNGTYADRFCYARQNTEGLPILDVQWGPKVD